jgi:hypothetical protein
VNFAEVLVAGFGLFLGILVIALLFHFWTEISFWLISMMKRLFWLIRRNLKGHRKTPGCQ